MLFVLEYWWCVHHARGLLHAYEYVVERKMWVRSIFKRSHTKTTRHFLPHFLTKRTSLLEETNEFSSALSSCRSPGGSEARSKRSRVVTRCSSSPTPDLPYVFALYSPYFSRECGSLELHFFPGRITSTSGRQNRSDVWCFFFSLSYALTLFCSRMRAHRNHRLVLTLNTLFSFSNALSRCNDIIIL